MQKNVWVVLKNVPLLNFAAFLMNSVYNTEIEIWQGPKSTILTFVKFHFLKLFNKPQWLLTNYNGTFYHSSFSLIIGTSWPYVIFWQKDIVPIQGLGEISLWDGYTLQVSCFLQWKYVINLSLLASIFHWGRPSLTTSV